MIVFGTPASCGALASRAHSRSRHRCAGAKRVQRIPPRARLSLKNPNAASTACPSVGAGAPGGSGVAQRGELSSLMHTARMAQLIGLSLHVGRDSAGYHFVLFRGNYFMNFSYTLIRRQCAHAELSRQRQRAEGLVQEAKRECLAPTVRLLPALVLERGRPGQACGRHLLPMAWLGASHAGRFACWASARCVCSACRPARHRQLAPSPVNPNLQGGPGREGCNQWEACRARGSKC